MTLAEFGYHIYVLSIYCPQTLNFILYLFYEDYMYPVATSNLLKQFYIMGLSNVSILSVSDDGYFGRI